MVASVLDLIFYRVHPPFKSLPGRCDWDCGSVSLRYSCLVQDLMEQQILTCSWATFSVKKNQRRKQNN